MTRDSVLATALLALLACSDPPIVSPRRCPGLPNEMTEGEVVRVTVDYRDVQNALGSITSSITQAGGHAEYELFEGGFAADIDVTAASVLCRHGLVISAVEELPFAPN